ncbi:hypothetical protein Vadar_017854 [Vaccinium darrowii]|uniref:Uncharacterized protein n=1 Tax=Vaccinium darrowii TaxID=229202 RepID=A0ACB7ZCB6_9ERIC|nr:hypothetical protein Vadar_017854 [Vaccinium darrowii]
MWHNCGKKQLFNSASAVLVEPFRIYIATLLSLLLPISFLLLARLSTADYQSTFIHNPNLSSLFLHSNSSLFHALVCLISFAALIQTLTGWIPLISKSTEPIFQPHLYAAWILLCALLVYIGFSIKGSIAAGIDGYGFGHKNTCLIIRVMFLLGLHETMLYWSRMVVKPVVDDTILGFVKEEMWIDRVVMAAGCGALWWRRLKDEVETLVVMVEVKKEMAMGVGVADFVGWWLYYQTVIIGLVMIVKGTIWVGVIMLCRRRRVEGEVNPGFHSGDNEEDKV